MDAIQTSFDCSDLENPMGERSKDALQVNFDRKLKLEFHGTKVTSDAGLITYRELDEILGLTTMIESELTDNRTGKNTQHGCLAMLKQSIYSRLAGSEEEIISDFSTIIVPKIVEYEVSARTHLLSKQPDILNDKVYRALGVLKNAYLITSQEALLLLSHLRMGINMNRLEGISIPTINELFQLTQPAHLQLNNGRTLDPTQRDVLRAQIIREHLN